MEQQKILVIDDNIENIKLTGNLLKQNGYEVLTALSGLQGIKIAIEKQPDLVLLDLMMPEIDGFETARRFKENPKISGIPIIFLTAKEINKFITKAFEVGGADYVMKPININELLARVDTQLSLKARTDELEKAYDMIKNKNKELNELLITDGLTKLYTRGYLMKKMKEEKTRYKRYKASFSLIMCDIDHFKKVNDTYGHDAGDLILKKISKLMQNSSREQDTIARWGGEEFMILLPETTIEEAHAVAQRILETLREKVYTYEEEEISLTMSFGLTMYEDKESIDELIKRVDEKLYEAKDNGRDQICQ
jgi:diguanylate cyclase (GGDEF)-like protein